MEELVEQVKILAQTMQTMIARSEQLFQMQQEKSKILEEVAEKLGITIDNLEVTDEALKRSLSESDQQIDDLAKIVAAMLQLQQSQAQTAGAQ
jgi:acetolactate synthase small subunit